jgi:V/A-type H+-transporting ATPase subunit D
VAEKIKLNKNTLRDQRDALKLYEEFLPTLELRKQQLQAEVRKLVRIIEEEKQRLEERLAGAAQWSGLLGKTSTLAAHLVKIEEVMTAKGNVAGVRIPVLTDVRFAKTRYSLLATPLAIDTVVDFWKRVIKRREALKIRMKQLEMLNRELTKTTQRINLYEKVLIPECRENIRRIKVYLGDQQTAAVCRAKIAKAKLVAKAEMEAVAPSAGGIG